MSDQGEQGETGERGDSGDRGVTGERGEKGDHGQPGDIGETGVAGKVGTAGPRGLTGHRGSPGIQGEEGKPYQSWLTRNVLAAYGVLVFGIVCSFLLSGFLYTQALEEVAFRARQTCEAGNERSQLQIEDLEISRRQSNELDLGRLLGIEDPAEVDATRRLINENTNRRIASVPFVDCNTGLRQPPPSVPSTPMPEEGN